MPRAASKSNPPPPRIGISGWRYGPWRGVFYPSDLPQKRELEFASRRVNSIEINASFYSLQRPSSYLTWRQQTPDDFIFSVKGGRFITHMKRLRDVKTPLANFLASGVLGLEEKLGPILWQFPPNFQLNADLIDEFLTMLPRTTFAAAELAHHHDEKLTGRSWMRPAVSRPMHYAMEVRHESFQTPQFIKLLRHHNVAVVIADTAGKWPLMEDITADFIYARLHGDIELYASGYTDAALDEWASRFKAWQAGRQPPDARRVDPGPPPKKAHRDLYVYFDNDAKVHAPFDAQALASRMMSVANAV